MKKELPKIFQNKINKFFNNNSKVAYSEHRSTSKLNDIDSLFKPNEIYKTDVKITLKDRVIEKRVIGRTKNNLITLDNEIIPISNIIEIQTM